LTPRGKVRLDEGRYKHSPCPTCNEPPATRTVLTPDVQLILRRRWCAGRLVDFHLVIQSIDATGWRDVVRFSLAHSNFHRVQLSWNPKRRQDHVFGPIDRHEQVDEAYRIAIRLAYSELETYLRNWRAR
jgi:hypothetical protein